MEISGDWVYFHLHIYTTQGHVLYEKHEGGVNLIWVQDQQSGKGHIFHNRFRIALFRTYWCKRCLRRFFAVGWHLAFKDRKNFNRIMTWNIFGNRHEGASQWQPGVDNRRRFLSNKTQFPLRGANGSLLKDLFLRPASFLWALELCSNNSCAGH